mmetsp:Transcript_14671/g.31411  ORF Transcript_14671/g.31411 Transcript_14671/m.31411 type:complete len:119 (-) Transcript_14671:443-799(-)
MTTKKLKQFQQPSWKTPPPRRSLRPLIEAPQPQIFICQSGWNQSCAPTTPLSQPPILQLRPSPTEWANQFELRPTFCPPPYKPAVHHARKLARTIGLSGHRLRNSYRLRCTSSSIVPV